MRVTNLMMTNNAIRYMDENRARLASLQEQNSSGKAFQYASQDPANATSAISLRSSLDASEAYLDTTNNANFWMSATDTALGQFQTIATKALALANEGISDTVGDAERRFALATEIQGLFEQAVDVGNTSHNGSYIFGGYRVKSPPFAADATYSGDNNTITQTISPSVKVPVSVNGTVFGDFFTQLESIQTALSDPNFDRAALQTAISGFQTAVTEDIQPARAMLGARQREVQMTMSHIKKTQIEVKKLLSSKEDVNMAETLSYLEAQRTNYQLVIEVSSRAVSSSSLFDYLR